MPTLTDPKNDQDEKLNPGQAHYDNAFNKIASHPDNQIGSVAANPDKPLSTNELKSGEQSPGFSYSGGKNPASSKKRESIAQTIKSKATKKNILAGGGIAGILLSFIVGFLGFLPFKVVSLIESLTNKAGAQVQDIIEQRTEKALIRSIASRAFNKTIGGDLALVVTQGPFAKIRTSSLEKSLAKKGITIDAEKGVVNLADGSTARNLDELRTLFGSDNKLNNTAIKAIVKEDIPTWRYFKRAKFAKWLRIKYNIPRFGSEKEKNSADKDAKQAAQELLDAEDLKNAEKAAQGQGDMFACVLSAGSDCVGDTNQKPVNSDQQVKPGDPGQLPSQQADSGNSSAGEDVVDKPKAGTKPDKSGVLKGVRESISKRVAEVTAKSATAKFAVGAIPIVGWIDLAATLNHMLREEAETGFLSNMVSNYKIAQAARQFGTWSGYSDQIKAGEASPELVGLLSERLNANSEGQGSETLDASSSATAMNIANTPNNSLLNENQRVDQDSESFIHQAAVVQQALTPVSALLEGWYYTAGWLLQKIGDGIAAISGALLSVLDAVTGGIVGDLLDGLTDSMMNAMKDFLGLDVANPLARGGELYDSIGLGAAGSFNQYCKEDLGCRKLTTAQAIQRQTDIAQRNNEYIQSKGIAYRLFSPENNSSLVAKLAINLPSTGRLGILGNTLSATSSLVSSMPRSIFSTVSKPVGAADANESLESLYALSTYGATQEDLDKPFSDTAALGEACPEVDSNTFDTCRTDKLVAESLACAINNDLSDKECLGGTAGSSSSASTAGGGVTPFGPLPSGTTQELATQISNSPNFNFKNPQIKSDFSQIASTGRQTACGGVDISPKLMGVLLVLSNKYDITLGVINNGHECDGRFHPKGMAVDINGVKNRQTGATTLNNQVRFLPSEQQVILDFYNDAGAVLAAAGGGGLGQLYCFDSVPQPTKVPGVVYFDDGCDHLHLDVGNR